MLRVHPSTRRHKNNDIIILEKVFLICGVLGIIPFPSATKCRMSICFFCFLNIAIHILGISESSYFTYTFVAENNISTVGIFINIFDFSTGVGFVVVCIFTSIKRRMVLKKLFRCLWTIEQITNAPCVVKNKQFYIRISLYHSILLFIVLNKILNNAFVIQHATSLSNLNTIYNFLILYMTFWLMLAVDILVKVFEITYNKCENEMIIIFNMLSVLIGHKKYRESKKLERMFFLQQKGVEYMNELFGLPILMIIVNACAKSLSAFNYILLFKRTVSWTNFGKMAQLLGQAVVSFQY